MTTDYYAVLGVRRDASADQIKMAYRRLARELHPDVNPDPVTHERFKKITQAHEVLSDPDKRQMYDLGDDPFAAAGGYFGQARREPSKEDWYPRGRWESHRERWPPQPSGGAWNQSWDQAPFSDYLGGPPPSSAYDWRLAAWVVPTSGLLYGAQVGYPPSKMPLPGWHWARREPANGAKVPHTPGKHNRVNLMVVLGLNSGVTNGQAAGIDIWYHVGGSHYHLRTATRLDVQVGEAGTC